MNKDWLLSALNDAAIDLNVDLTEELLAKLLPKFIEESSSKLYNTLIESNDEPLADRRRVIEAFEDRLRDRWEDAFSLLETLILLCEEAGIAIFEEDKPSDNNDPLLEVMIKFHARALQVSMEILCLLKSGFSDGALARWRSLHELVVIAYFINDNGLEMAQRFLDHEHVSNYKEALLYKKYEARLGLSELKEEDFEELENQIKILVNKYGKEFKEDYGWTSHIIPNRGDRNFNHIEKITHFDHLKPYYKLACNAVHSGAKSIKYKLGLIEKTDADKILLTGPTNYGLATPGQNTAISLNQITTILLTYQLNFDRLIYSKAISIFADNCKAAFVRIQSDIEKEHNQINK